MATRAYPQELKDAEAARIRLRPKWRPGNAAALLGVGLSGGGIRSATFCLGFFQQLARLSKLGEMDFLSTVSGGGYFGSAYGRLFTRRTVGGKPATLATIESTLGAVPESGFVAWLRENGRYLSPRGSGDLLLALAATIRAWGALQILLLMAIIPVFCALQLLEGEIADAMAGSDLWSRYVAWLDWKPAGIEVWGSAYTAVPLGIALLVATPLAWAFWVLPSDSRTGSFSRSLPIGMVTTVVAGLVLANRDVRMLPFGLTFENPPYYVAIGRALTVVSLITLALVGIMWADVRRHTTAKTVTERIFAYDKIRHRYSVLFKWALMAVAITTAFVVVDSLGQTLYARARVPDSTVVKRLSGVLVTLGTAASLLGRFVPIWRRGEGKSTPIRGLLPAAAGIAAFVLVLLLLTAVDVLSHAIVWQFDCPGRLPQAFCDAPKLPTGACCNPAAPNPSPCCPPWERGPVLWSVGLVIAFLSGLAVISGRSWPLLNATTQLPLYRARLARAYLGASNPARYEEGPGRSVLNVLPGDDQPIESYHATEGATDGTVDEPMGAAELFGKGAPLHIINVTINETVGGQSQVEQQDRKGVPLAIGPCGMSAGVRHHLVRNGDGTTTYLPTDGYRVFDPDLKDGAEPMTVGQWIAISGAAFSTGIGYRTSLGLSLLAGFANVRLGYWWNSGIKRRNRAVLRRLLPVQTYVLDEFLARFRGTAERFWYLTDGGHFENLGGYELLRRRLPLIMLIDAEADPDFTYVGLSDLVMKARVDLDAEIHFLDASELTELLAPDQLSRFGTLDQLRRGAWEDGKGPLDGDKARQFDKADYERFSWRHAAIARVQYSEPAETTWLIYVKATVVGDEPLDVLQYHRENPAFPHQTTGDQFFDERQWESYRKLGEHVAATLFAPSVAGANGWVPGTLRPPTTRT